MCVVMNLLEEWHLGHLVPIFRDQNIDSIEIFQTLTDEDLKELIPTLGDRKLFKLKLTQYMEMNKKSPTPVIDVMNTPVIIESIFMDADAPEDPPAKYLRLDTNNSEQLASESSCILTSVKSNPNSVSVTSEASSSAAIYECFDMYLRPSEITNFNMRNLIESHILGRAILTKYESKHTLENKDRNTLCEIIVCHFLNHGKRLTNELISLLADRLVEIFATEKKATYFVSPITKKRARGNKPEIARGKLIDKHRNKLTILRRSLGISNKTVQKENKQTPDFSQEAKDGQIWLKNNMEPEEEVLRHWSNSYSIRKMDNNSSITDFFDEWPILKSQMCIRLVNYDFAHKYNLQEGFHMKGRFELLYNNTYEKRKQLLKPSDETLNDLLAEEITYDSKAAIKLYLLAALVPPKSRLTVNKKQWKPSISECRDGFLVQVKVAGDIDKIKQERIDLMYSKGLTVQPYLIVVGPNLSNIIAAYVVVNNITFKTDSVLSALEFCFHACMIFDVQYSFECRHLWYLLQWELFNIHSSNDPKIPYISDLLEISNNL